jgi:amidase
MHRRNFLKTGSIAGLTLTTLAAASCTPASPDKKQDDAAAGEKADDFVLNEITIDAL